jgi:hypothetical protein
MWNSIPTANNQNADLVLGQTDFISSNYGTSNLLLNYPTGVFYDGNKLFVVDNSNYRVLIWNSLPTSNGQAADAVMGQPDFVTANENQGGLSGSSLNYPTDLYSDGVRMFISDTDNNRVLIAPIPGI